MKIRLKIKLQITQFVYFLFLLSTLTFISAQEKMKHKHKDKQYKNLTPQKKKISHVAVDEDYSYGHGFCDAKMNCFLPFAESHSGN